jgi:hypothetical protein
MIRTRAAGAGVAAVVEEPTPVVEEPAVELPAGGFGGGVQSANATVVESFGDAIRRRAADG